MNLTSEISKASQRISSHILNTPLFHSMYLSAMNCGEVYLKLESEQVTGSFKARGALNKIMAASDSEKAKGFITASTGNHAQGFARALSITGNIGTIYLPENADPSKVEALRFYDVELNFYGNGSLETELYAKEIAREKGVTWVSPYNDMDIIHGQGTIGKEITELLKPDALLGCIGGGGLMSGVSNWLKNNSSNTKVIGCLPEMSPEMYLSVKENKIVEMEPQETLSDGSAGGLEPGSITFDICKENVDSYLLASESEIAAAIKLMAEKHHKIIEGAAGVSVASFIKNTDQFKNQTVVIIICGANISTKTLMSLL